MLVKWAPGLGNRNGKIIALNCDEDSFERPRLLDWIARMLEDANIIVMWIRSIWLTTSIFNINVNDIFEKAKFLNIYPWYDICYTVCERPFMISLLESGFLRHPSYRKIEWSRETTRLLVWIIASLWNWRLHQQQCRETYQVSEWLNIYDIGYWNSGLVSNLGHTRGRNNAYCRFEITSLFQYTS